MKSQPVAPPPPAFVSLPTLGAQVREQGTTSVVTVVGEIDISCVDELRRVVDRVLLSRPETLLLDLEEVEFCDSTAIHLVLQTHSRATVQGIRLLVVPPAGNARRAFEICRVGDHVALVGPKPA